MSRTKPLKPGLPESTVLEQVLEALALFGPALDFDRNNVGGMYNAGGSYVRYGRKFDPDIRGQIRSGPWKGATLLLETKNGLFDPRKARGKERERFLGQLQRLKDVNAGGGVGLWVNDSSQVVESLPKILAGARVEFDEDGFPWVVSSDEPEGG
jgi:hypothetical protein